MKLCNFYCLCDVCVKSELCEKCILIDSEIDCELCAVLRRPRMIVKCNNCVKALSYLFPSLTNNNACWLECLVKMVVFNFGCNPHFYEWISWEKFLFKVIKAWWTPSDETAVLASDDLQPWVYYEKISGHCGMKGNEKTKK